jgi:hypothetical protein
MEYGRTGAKFAPGQTVVVYVSAKGRGAAAPARTRFAADRARHARRHQHAPRRDGDEEQRVEQAGTRQRVSSAGKLSATARISAGR